MLPNSLSRSRKIRTGLIVFAAAAICLLTFMAMLPAPPAPPPPPPEDSTQNFHEEPPIALNAWVTKLADTTTGNVLLEIEFAEDTTLHDSLVIHYMGDSTTFYDDGTHGDSVADDFVYSAHIFENLSAFSARITEINDTLSSRGEYIYFKGHDGYRVTGSDVHPFDVSSFNNGVEVQLPESAIANPYFTCLNSLFRENSLFITDLDVVGSTTPPSQWSFGTLMQNMANCTGTNCTRDFIKAWLKNWTDPQTVNGQTPYIRM